ncbi:MAG: dihydropteroate synthase [Actinobacteria bacterium HGW-Actinobacteria-1]|nr:MAG: dihydropteroate synthase [Actinobacteria bacterium HGW-Actinobacteria-1]
MSPVWRCGRFALDVSKTLVMGVLNVTPDSFSDGGEFEDPISALERGRQMVAEGAAIIDVGGESTRPGSDEVPPAEEVTRVRPVVAALARDYGVPVSVDTRHASVARAAVEAGASIVNDVSGFRDPEMMQLAAETDAGLVIMHMLGEPKTMQSEPRYTDVVGEVGEYLLGRARELEALGVARERICVDPGIGFGKTLEHNLELLRRLPELAELGYPVLVGASRKSLIGIVLAEPDPKRRLEGSLAIAMWAAAHAAAVVRVHDVYETVRVLRTWSAIEGESA